MLVVMRRTGFLLGGWVVATVLAIAVGLLGVRAVSDSVTSSRPASLSPASVRAALDTTTTSTTLASVEEPSPTATEDGSSASSSDDSPSNGSLASSFDDGSSSAAGAAPEDRTYQLGGGSVGVRFENEAAHLLWAQPNAGYTIDSGGSSSGVDVRFRQIDGDRESRLKAYWDNGPQSEVEEK